MCIWTVDFLIAYLTWPIGVFLFFHFLNLLIPFPLFQLYLYNIIHVPLSHLTPCHPALHKS